MSNYDYSDTELKRYFADRKARSEQEQEAGSEPDGDETPTSGGLRERLLDTPPKRQAAVAVGAIGAFFVVFGLFVLLYLWSLGSELPSIEQIDAPTFQLATVAYSADGEELQRYARENRSWATYNEISPNVVDALISTEDHRFYDHWGIDVFRTISSVVQTLLGDRQGGSSITQQLARNLYNEQIGRKVTVERKVKEMVTAIQLERRYTKTEIVEMYLNTVEFGNNAFGIDAAARTFFGKKPLDLNVLESATLIGMLKGITLYNPIRNPENAARRRNVVLSLMVRRGKIPQSFFDTHRQDSVTTHFRASDITEGRAPYFAEYVRNWMREWARENEYDLYTAGLTVFTTLDTRLQDLAQEAVEEQAGVLQKVVDYEWSRRGGYEAGTTFSAYTRKSGYEPFSYLWESRKDLITSFVRESDRLRKLRSQGVSADKAAETLLADAAFIDSLKAAKSRLEAGLVSIDPRTGFVKAWVGGRDLATDWFDHVALAARQPGSTFKPFVYTAAIDNGYSPYHMLVDSTFLYTDVLGNEWSPMNSGFAGTGELMTLREGLTQSKNTITGRLVLLISPSQVAFYARRMGIVSPLQEVPALALGTSDVTLLELTTAYSTLANRGERNEPVVVTQILDQFGNTLYQYEPSPREAISEDTADIMVDMMRGVIKEGTGRRINFQYMLGEYDLAGKTGTTQNNADGWFMLMHPELVTGVWVGFNDRRVAFRSDYWGQGAHNALHIAGDFFRRATESTKIDISKEEQFPTLEDRVFPSGPIQDGLGGGSAPRETVNRDERGRVGW